MYEEYDVKERLSELAQLFGASIVRTDKSFYNTNKIIDRLSTEMRAFKDEVKEFKDEMKADRREMAKQWNKQWGELANKMGTLVEEIIAPAVRPVMAQCFKEEVDYPAVNVRKHDKATGLRCAFDVVASSQSYVFLVETKSSPKVSDIAVLLEQQVPRFRELFPEFATLKMIPVLASLRFDDSMLQPATEAGVFLMAYRQWEYMDLLNFNELKGGALIQDFQNLTAT